MASNLVLASLLIAVVCISGGVQGSLLSFWSKCPFTELNDHLRSAINPANDDGKPAIDPDNVKENLGLAKEFVARNMPGSKLARELAKLDADHMCLHGRLTILREVVEMIRAADCGEQSRRLMEVIQNYAQQAMESCFDIFDRSMDGHMDDIFSALTEIDHLPVRLVSVDDQIVGFVLKPYAERPSAAQVLISGKNMLVGKKPVPGTGGHYVAALLSSFRRQENPWQNDSFSPDEGAVAEEDIERLIIEPCKSFTEYRLATDILVPLRDLTLATHLSSNWQSNTAARWTVPSNRVALWTGRLMTCEWLKDIGAKKLVKKFLSNVSWGHRGETGFHALLRVI